MNKRAAITAGGHSNVNLQLWQRFLFCEFSFTILDLDV